MTHDGIDVTITDRLARVALDRPERRNALSLGLMRPLTAELRTIAARADVAVVVLEGRGPAFSAGHDLSELAGTTDETALTELFAACVELMETLHAIPQPVIARVHGVATAAGCQLVAACDLAICTDDARFATPGVNIGLFCSTPMVPITRAVGRKRAMQMLLTGDMIDAHTAADWGLVNQVVPRDALDDAVDALATKIAQASPRVVALGKRAFYAQVDASESGAYAVTAPVMVANAQLPDAREEESTRSLTKRPPVWPA